MKNNTVKSKSVYSNFVYKSNKFESKNSEIQSSFKSATVPIFCHQQNVIEKRCRNSSDVNLHNSSTQTSKTILELANIEKGIVSSEYMSNRNSKTNTNTQTAFKYENKCEKFLQDNENIHFFLHDKDESFFVENQRDEEIIINRNFPISLTSTSISNRSNILQQTSPLKHLISLTDETLNEKKIDHQNLAEDAENEPFWMSTKLLKNISNPDCDDWSSSCLSSSKTSLKDKSSISYMASTISSEKKSAQSIVKRLGTLFDSKKEACSNDNDIPRYDEISQDLKSISYIDKTNSNSSCNSSISKATTISSIKMKNDSANKKVENSSNNALHKKFVNGDESLMKFNKSCETFMTLPLKKLKSKDWNYSVQGLAEIIEFCRIADMELINPHMIIINQRLIELLRSPRSHVCKAACKAAGQLFELARDTRRPEFDELVEILLCKTADANRFIRQDANLSLDSMVTHISCSHSIRALCLRGPTHKNHLVRLATVRLIVCAVVIAGPENILNPNISEHIRKRIFTYLPKFLEDKNIEVRRLGERLYQVLSSQFRFDMYLKKYLDKEDILKMKKQRGNIL